MTGDSCFLFPNLFRDFFYEFQLRPLLFLGQLVADFTGSKAALRALAMVREAEVIAVGALLQESATGA